MRHAGQRFEFGSDPEVLARCHLGWVEWNLDRPGGGSASSEAAVVRARSLKHPHSLAFALAFHACLKQFEMQPGASGAAAEELIQLAQAQDYAYWGAWGEILKGWATGQAGDSEKGEHLIRRGIQHYTATGAVLLHPYALYLLADVMGRARQVEEALVLLDQSLAEAETHSIRFWKAETLRLKGELLMHKGSPEAIIPLREAEKVAAAQGAMELWRRARTSIETYS
jgi:predicted ATPase